MEPRLRVKRPRDEGPASHALPSPADAAVRVQSALRGFAVRRNGLALRRQAHAADARAARREREASALTARLRSVEYRQLGRCCKGADLPKLASVDQALEGLIGLRELKDYCAAVRRDCLARAALGETPLVRNVLISGNLGVGKKLAAETLASLLRALGVAKGIVATQTTLDQLVLDVRRDVSCVVVEGLVNVEATRGKVDAVLANYPNHCFIFVGPTQGIEALHGAVPHFRKVTNQLTNARPVAASHACPPPWPGRRWSLPGCSCPITRRRSSRPSRRHSSVSEAMRSLTVSAYPTYRCDRIPPALPPAFVRAPPSLAARASLRPDSPPHPTPHVAFYAPSLRPTRP